MYIYIYIYWIIGSLVRKINNQLFGRTFYTETKFSKIESSWWQNPVFYDKSFCTPRFIFLKIGF